MVTLAAAATDDGPSWVLWVLGGLGVWLVVGFLVALVIGRGIRLADRRDPATGRAAVLTTADLPDDLRVPADVPGGLPGGVRIPAVAVRRQALPLPPIGVALAAVAVALETTGYVFRLTGSTGTAAQVLSMDAPFSLPRIFVAALFGAAALAAVAGAGVFPGRRTWWLAVAFVAGGVAAVKAGSTLHADALHALEGAIGSSAALLLSAVVAGAVLLSLWFLSRTERRDRRRILSVLALYAGASVGLSALSSVAAGAYGGASTWATAATYLEESGEALAGVAFLVAVLAGVAPRLVLPGTWPLRRSVDAQTLDLPEQLPGRPVTDRSTQN